MDVKLKTLLAMSLLVCLGACQQEVDQAPAMEVGDGVETPDTTDDPNSMQAIRDAQLARESMPGKVHYEAHCESCHNGTVQKAPHKDMVGLMTAEAILKTLTDGVMQAQGAVLSQAQKEEVSEYLAGRALGEEQLQIPSCPDDVQFDALAPNLATNWGMQDNQRVISSDVGGLTKASFANLEPKWAVSFTGANRVRSQPSFAGGLLFVGSHNGKVYALDQTSGCQVWSFQASGEVRTGIVVAPYQQEDNSTALYFGDVLGNVYGVEARTGAMLWRLRADDHPNATITGTPSFANGNVYIPVSSLEVALAVDPYYECCTFQGSVLAVDAESGERLWQTSTIAEKPTVQSQNSLGTNMIGPSGAVVWNSPTIDSKRNRLYVGTGENMSSPATDMSDALIAMDLTTGEILWAFQATANDAWNTACDTDTPQSCPEEDGPDFDFGGATLLAHTQAHGELVVAGQKSGLVHALNPDTGALVWQTRVGRGGIQGGIHFGIAAQDQRIFVPVSDMADGRTYPNPDRPGMHALDANTGEILWSTIHTDECKGRAFCHPGISQVPTVIGDVVVAGAMDGIARAYDIETGAIVWSLDTTQSFATILGESTKGGSFSGAAGPIAFNGMLYLSSGYGIYNHMAGNLFLALAPPE